MWKQLLLTLLVLYAILECVGCACSSVGYPSGAHINVFRAEWSLQPININVEKDGTLIQCSNIKPGAFSQSCDGNVFVTYEPTLACSGCGSANSPHLSIWISETPECIRLSITENDILLGEETFEPDYVGTYHEGLGCGETFYWARNWELP